ncbi:hypothetical protein BaRGS_00001237 [Batillaria attramentaria]|uniref:Uncharacterized protein n=1 Tax=Batillaria attramentaria TaxID=370345 RepID=A0ABD0M6L9_9CAEN
MSGALLQRESPGSAIRSATDSMSRPIRQPEMRGDVGTGHRARDKVCGIAPSSRNRENTARFPAKHTGNYNHHQQRHKERGQGRFM